MRACLFTCNHAASGPELLPPQRLICHIYVLFICDKFNRVNNLINQTRPKETKRRNPRGTRCYVCGDTRGADGGKAIAVKHVRKPCHLGVAARRVASNTISLLKRKYVPPSGPVRPAQIVERKRKREISLT